MAASRVGAGELSEEVRTIIRSRHCAGCHTPGHLLARPGALAIFDLSRDDWAAGLTARQLDLLRSRLFERPSAEELRGLGVDPGEPPLTDLQRAKVTAFAGVESLSRRGGDR